MKRRIRDSKSYWSTSSKMTKPIELEKLEPRILLSGDGLLSNIAPPDPLLDGMQQPVQYAELLETNGQVDQPLSSPEQKINQELDTADALETDICKPRNKPYSPKAESFPPI
ncbi:LEPR-XLL domain-containing protein [Planctomycetota bacterium]